jgi:L-asparaginase
MTIRILITGGTIDCERIEQGDKYVFEKTYLPEMLKQGRCKLDIKSQVLFLKRSIFTTDEDRENILHTCKDCKENKIIITHGTDTMRETAQVLGKEIKDKTIVLLGAMIPFNQEKSDALFNLGCAVSAVQSLPNGIYVTMNGKIFDWDNFKKNKELGVFEVEPPAL